MPMNNIVLIIDGDGSREELRMVGRKGTAAQDSSRASTSGYSRAPSCDKNLIKSELNGLFFAAPLLAGAKMRCQDAERSNADFEVVAKHEKFLSGQGPWEEDKTGRCDGAVKKGEGGNLWWHF